MEKTIRVAYIDKNSMRFSLIIKKNGNAKITVSFGSYVNGFVPFANCSFKQIGQTFDLQTYKQISEFFTKKINNSPGPDVICNNKKDVEEVFNKLFEGVLEQDINNIKHISPFMFNDVIASAYLKACSKINRREYENLINSGKDEFLAKKIIERNRIMQFKLLEEKKTSRNLECNNLEIV